MSTHYEELDPNRRTFLLHFDGVDGQFTLLRQVVGGNHAAYRLALELCAGRVQTTVRGVEEVSTDAAIRGEYSAAV